MTEIALQKIERESVTEKVVGVLRARILAGDLAPNTRLIESQLADQLGVSRAPIREAFRILEPEGLIISEAGKGTFVAEISAEDLREIFTLRSVLEGMAMRLIVERITRDQLDELQGIVEQMQQAADRGDAETLVDLDLGFHERIWQLSGHKRLYETLANMIGPIRLFLAVNSQVYGDLVDNVLEHVELHEAMSSRDAKRAQRMMVKHIEEAGKRNLAYLDAIKRRTAAAETG
jgi:DNA-binding GntR family transcriptional regulator